MRGLRQTAWYWKPNKSVDQHGKEIYTPAQEIKVRWQDQNSKITTKDMVDDVSSAKVWTEIHVMEGGYLKLQTTENMNDTQPDNPCDAGAKQIMSFRSIPNLRNTRTENVSFLK